MAEPASRTSRSSLVLAIGSAASGLLAFVYFAIVTHVVGADAAAPFAILWALWAYASAGVTFPLQHWTIRAVTSTGGEREVRRSRPMLFAVAAVLAGLTWLISFLLREPLFGEHGAVFALLAAATTLGAAVAGVVRGILTARERFTAVATTLGLENGARVLIAIGLAVAGVDSIVPYGLALLGGYVVATAWPSAWRLGRTGEEHSISAVGFLASASAGQLMGHVVLTSGPVVLALGGGAPAAVTSLFAALALFRAPYLLMLGVVAGLTGRLTRAVLAAEIAVLERFRRAVAVGSLGLAAVAAAGAALWGHWVLALVYGADVTLPDRYAAIVAAGCVLAMGNLMVSVLLLSLNRAALAFPAWLVAAVPGALILIPGWLPGDPSLLGRVCVSFLVIEIGAFAALIERTLRPVRQLR